jgi:hypothetical protein
LFSSHYQTKIYSSLTPKDSNNIMSVPYKNVGPVDASIEADLTKLKDKNVIVTGGMSWFSAIAQRLQANKLNRKFRVRCGLRTKLLECWSLCDKRGLTTAR